jgi:hypothetical protein
VIGLVGDSRHRNLYVATIWLTIRSLMRDKEQMEALIRSSGAECLRSCPSDGGGLGEMGVRTVR